AGAVDQDVDPAELAAGIVEQRLDLRRVGEIGAVVADPPAVAGELVGRGLPVAEAVENDVGAAAGEDFGNAEADVAGRAGDQGSLAIEHHGFPSHASNK